MIVDCEECKSKFDLDESLLDDEGSKVKCSICNHVFTAFPPESEPDQTMDDGLEETVALDSPPVFDEPEPETEEEDTGLDFDTAFDDALEGDDKQEVSSDTGAEPEEERDIDLDEAMDQAAKIEENVVREEDERKSRDDSEEEEIVTSSPKKKPGRSRIPIIISVVVLLILGGAIALFFLVPDLIPDSLSPLLKTQKEKKIDQGVRRLTFKAVNGSFIKTSEAGQRFVIKGSVLNNNPNGQSFILIKGSILDNQGKLVKNKSVYAGNTFTEDQLKETPLEEINQGAKNRSGKNESNLNVEPGGSVPFMIVFENLPDNLSEFTVEAVSSQGGG